MSWELYDKNSFVDYLGSTYNLKALMDLKSSAVNQFLNTANTEQGADAQTVQNMIEELRLLPDWDWLVDILNKAEPPVRIADGTEEWLRETYPNEEWEEPISSPDDPRIPSPYLTHDTKRLTPSARKSESSPMKKHNLQIKGGTGKPKAPGKRTRRNTVKVLTANIQREWLVRIIAGSKKIEYRAATEYWFKRLWTAGPPPFQLRLINGMKADSPEATVLVNKVDIDLRTSEIRFHIKKVQSTTRWNKSLERQYPPIPPKPAFHPNDLLRRSLKPSRLTIQVPEPVRKAASKAGTHDFIFAADEDLAHKLNEQGPEPFRINLASGKSSVEVIAYQLFWEPFKKKLTASLITP